MHISILVQIQLSYQRPLAETGAADALPLEFLENKHSNIIAFYQDEGDVLTGRNVIDKYSITFDGRNSRLTVL